MACTRLDELPQVWRDFLEKRRSRGVSGPVVQAGDEAYTNDHPARDGLQDIAHGRWCQGPALQGVRTYKGEA